ncbi:hypothetical protein [Runella zeae]|uniref:hypothetical protein n=1 Tax=Runella zeae TaxID=94255 RepID=UPI00048E8C48|nr:hypothetical protein [Runella zeae]
MIFRDFFAPIYELWGLAYVSNFSSILYNEFYSEIGIYTVVLTLVGVCIYYYGICLINTRCNRWFHWAGVMLVCAVIGYFMMTIQADSYFNSLNPPVIYSTAALTQLSFINAIFIMVLFYLFSFVRKIPKKGAGGNTPH